LEFGGGGITGEDDLAIAEGFEVEGEGEDGDGGGGVFEGLAEEAEELAGLGGPGWAIEHFGEAEEVEGGEGVWGGFGAVVVFFDAEDAVGLVGVDGEVAAVFGIEEEAIHFFLEGDGPLEVGDVEGGLVEFDEAVDEAGVVDGEGFGAAFAFAPRAMQAFAGRGAKLIVDELCGSGGECGRFGIAKGGSGIAIVSELFARQFADKSIVLVRFRPDIRHEYAFITAKDATMSRVAQRFYEHCLRYFEP
jgi:hypothetical protein